MSFRKNFMRLFKKCIKSKYYISLDLRTDYRIYMLYDITNICNSIFCLKSPHLLQGYQQIVFMIYSVFYFVMILWIYVHDCHCILLLPNEASWKTTLQIRCVTTLLRGSVLSCVFFYTKLKTTPG